MNRGNTIRQPWLTAARAGWVILAAYNCLPGLLGLPDYYRQLVALDPWPNNPGWTATTFGAAVTQAGIAPQTVAWIMLLPVLLKILASLSIGLLIFWRKSDEWQSLLASFVLVGLCGTFAGDRFGLKFLAALQPFWQVVAREAWVFIFLAFILFLTMFPDGRFAPSWMRWIAVSLIPWMIATEAIGLVAGQAPQGLFFIGFLLLALILIGQFYRYRRLSSPVERLQIRWFLFAISVFIIYGFIQTIAISIFPLPGAPGPGSLLVYLLDVYISAITYTLIPLAIGIAIFRYHLWDIDLIIRRTVQYSTLTLLLGLVYFGMVTLMQTLFASLAEQQSPILIVGSTLAIAALFNPLRVRLQAGVDRLFYRHQYDLELALADFANSTRQVTDLNALAGKLTDTVGETLQPELVSLWLASAHGLTGRQ